MIPEGSQRYNELIDVVIQSETKYEDVEQKDGTITKEQVLDSEGLWWKMLKVDSEKFGNVAWEVSELARMAEECFSNMTYNRAMQYSKQILGIVKSLKVSFAAMGSETRRNKHNSKRNFIDTLGKTSSEKIYTVKEDLQKSSWGAFLGGKTRDEIHDD